ncbi:hypothetical protein H632_c2702p0, partial [Helicosporidium sp. ATCC 50920]
MYSMPAVDQVAGGNDFACARAPPLVCWGSNQNGRLGRGPSATAAFYVSPAAVALPAGASGINVSAGGAHACAVVADASHTAYCWGGNQFGQLGNGSTTDSSTPVGVQPVSAIYVEMFAGDAHTCALASDGSLHCWGSNDYGQLAQAADVTQNVAPTRVLVPDDDTSTVWNLAAAGLRNSCATSGSGALYCWGFGGKGAIGNGGTADAYSPQRTSLNSTPAQLSMKGDTVLALVIYDYVYLWGDNSHCQAGTFASKGDLRLPLRVMSGVNYMFTTLTSIHMLSINPPYGQIVSFGSNEHGLIGTGGSTEDYCNNNNVRPGHGAVWGYGAGGYNAVYIE